MIQRLKSTDPVNIEGWSWQPFLEDAVKRLEGLNIEPYPVADRFLQREDQTGSKSKPISVTTATWACKTEKRITCYKIRYPFHEMERENG